MMFFDSERMGRVTNGIRGKVVADERDVRHVFPICEQASNRYGTMTKSA